jgi:hypothetical protein
MQHRGTPVVALLVVHAALLAFSALRHSGAFDESHYLVAGVYHWHTGRFELCRGSPPLTGLVAALPVLWTEHATDWSSVPQIRGSSYAVAHRFGAINGRRTDWLVMLGRWGSIAFSLAGGYFCFRWANELYGISSGLLVLALWCFSPYVLAHGRILSGDMPATAAGVAAFYMFWRWLKRPSLSRAGLAGLFLGIVELTKFVWVLLFALWPILWVFWKVVHRQEAGRSGWLREGGHLLLIVLLSLYVINLGYGFERPFQPLGKFEFGRRLLDRIGLGAPDAEHPNRVPSDWVAAIPLPLPENYLVGIDEIQECSSHKWSSYLRHEWREGGFWYYHPYSFLVKMPLGVFGLMAIAGAMALVPAHREPWRTELLLVLSAVAIFGFVNASNAPQSDRYTLPVLPFLLLLTGKAGQGFSLWHGRLAMLVGGFLSWAVLSSLFVYPHSSAYFNELAGGPLGGHAHLIGHSADYGTEYGLDYLYLEEWQKSHPDARPLRVSWRRPFSRDTTIEMQYSAVPSGPIANRNYLPSEMIPLGPQPGWYAVKVGTLHSRSGEFAYWFRFRPVAIIGYSIYVYHVTVDDANRVRRSLGMPELPAWWTGETKGPGTQATAH